MKKRLFLLVAPLLMLHVAFAQFNSHYYNRYSPYNFLYYKLQFGDLNGNHCADVLSFTTPGNIWYGYEINNNHLGSVFNISKKFKYYNVSIIDMNNDGYNDIVAQRDKKGCLLVILKNDGANHFTESIVFAADYGFEYTLGDLNSDNLNDIVLTGIPFNSQGNLIWLKNKGRYNFDKVDLLVKSGRSKAIIVDFNHDGKKDIVLKNSLPVWYENTGLEKFVPHNIDIYLGGETYNYLADMDNDGLIDILSLKNGYILFYKNLDNNTFVDGLPLFMVKSCSSYSLDDVDGDGYLDVVFNDGETGKLYWAKSNESGYYNTFTEFDVKASKEHVLTDINGDGIKDVVALFYDHDEPLGIAFINDGQGNFIKDTINYITPVSKFIPVKFKNHSLNDILFKGYKIKSGYPYSGSAVYLLKNRGGERFDFPEPVIEKWVDFFKTVDMDNDGDQDIFYVVSDNMLFWAENDGTNHFSVDHPIISDFYAKSDVQIKDIDGDSLPDVVAIKEIEPYYNEKKLYIIKNNGSGFDAPQLITERNTYFTVDDVNNDGASEIICTTDNNDFSLFYYDGNLMKEKIILTDYSVSASAVHDLDGDGKQDIFVIKNHTAGWFKNLGNFTFDSIRIILDSNDIWLGHNIGFFDWNNDGLLDIECFPSRRYFVNKGNGNYKLADDWIDIEIPGVERLVDMDGDGDLDAMDKIFDFEFCLNAYNNKTEKNITICRGDSVKNFNRWLKTSGDYYDTIPTALGGDSISVLHLNVADNVNAELPITGNQNVNEMDASEYFIEGDDNLSYFWDANNGMVVSDSGQRDVKIAWQSPGTGLVTASIYDPATTCFTRSELSVTVDKVMDAEMVIYPNPASGKLFVTKTFEGSVTEIYNQMGVLVLRSDQPEIDISMLPAGTYPVLIKSKANDVRARRKLVVY